MTPATTSGLRHRRARAARENTEYRFVSERGDDATRKYGVTSISLLAKRH